MSRVLGVVLALLGSVGSGVADEKEGGDNTEYLGNWRQVAVVIDGKDTPVSRAVLMTVTREGYAVMIDGQPYQKGKARSAGDESLRRTDLVIVEGTRAGETVPQITKVEGDVMIGCQAKLGGDRPTEFTSKVGSGRILSMWLRVN